LGGCYGRRSSEFVSNLGASGRLDTVITNETKNKMRRREGNEGRREREGTHKLRDEREIEHL